MARGVYDATYTRYLRDYSPTVEDVHYALTNDDDLNEINSMIDAGSASRAISDLVPAYRRDLDRSSERAQATWANIAPDKPFPHKALREAYNESDPTIFHDHVEAWASGYSGSKTGKNENWTDLSFRSEGYEQAKRDGVI